MKSNKGKAYTGGVIAVKEKKLLRDKIEKMCALGADEALKTLVESGFGGGASLAPEELVLADEREIDAFIREYTPSNKVTNYLLAPRDFHNAKALLKARHLSADATPLLGGEGIYSVETLARAVETEEDTNLPKELKGAIESANELLKEENPSGADAGFLFDQALYAYLNRVLGRGGVCKRLLVRRADMTNLLTAFRAGSLEEAEKYFVGGGSLSSKELSAAFEDTEKIKKAFEKSDYSEYVDKLITAKAEGKPYTEAEKELESFELGYFSKRPYELSGQGRFLYYVFRRRTENENVRVVFVCLNAGLEEKEIIKRLRGVR